MARNIKERNKKTKLIVVFDTNALYTKVANELVRNDIKAFIAANSTHGDIDVGWFLPESVINERRWQMERRAMELLPSIEKLEALLGHKLGISRDILASRIDDAIKKQMGELSFSVLAFDDKKVDLQDLVRRAAFRRPPFDDGEKEKGFRDAIIAESFVQLVGASPSSLSVCRIVLVTGDKLLSEYVVERTVDRKNVRVVNELGELESLINALVSEVTDEYVDEISGAAESLFFTKEDTESIYFKEGIREKIKAVFSDVFAPYNKDGCMQEFGTWWIGSPIFIKKEKQRITWVSPIGVDFKSYSYEVNEQGGVKQGALGLLEEERERPKTLLGGLALPPALKRVETGGGRYLFEVVWSVTVSQTKRLISPSIVDIRNMGSNQL